MQEMNIQCTCCGGTDVTCEARIKPNTNVFVDFTEESFADGYCDSCGQVILTDAEQIKNELQAKYDKYVNYHNCKPDYLQCEIVYTDKGSQQEFVKIMLHERVDKSIDDEFMYYCRDFEELKSYCVPCTEFFVITTVSHFGDTQSFKKLTGRI